MLSSWKKRMTGTHHPWTTWLGEKFFPKFFFSNCRERSKTLRGSKSKGQIFCSPALWNTFPQDLPHKTLPHISTAIFLTLLPIFPCSELMFLASLVHNTSQPPVSTTLPLHYTLSHHKSELPIEKETKTEHDFKTRSESNFPRLHLIFVPSRQGQWIARAKIFRASMKTHWKYLVY